MSASYLLFLVLFLLGLTVRFVYEKAKQSGRVDPENKLVFLVVFVAMCLLWMSWFNLGPLDPVRAVLPAAMRWAGFLLFLIGLGLALGALIQLKGLENIDHLVTGGLFSRVRHPMYTGFLLWIVGWPLFHGAVLSILPGLVGAVNVLYWRRLEDDRLASAYGEAYLAYRRRTWF